LSREQIKSLNNQ